MLYDVYWEMLMNLFSDNYTEWSVYLSSIAGPPVFNDDDSNQKKKMRYGFQLLVCQHDFHYASSHW